MRWIGGMLEKRRVLCSSGVDEETATTKMTRLNAMDIFLRDEEGSIVLRQVVNVNFNQHTKLHHSYAIPMITYP